MAFVRISSPIVALQTAMHCFTPIRSHMRFSNSCKNGPSLVSHLRSKTSLIRLRSVCLFPILGRPTCSSVLKAGRPPTMRSEEHTSELQSHSDLVCRLLLEK